MAQAKGVIARRRRRRSNLDRRCLDCPRLLRFARNDGVYRMNSFIQGGSAAPAGIQLAMERGYVLYSPDTDFARFTGLRWVNPSKEARGS
jgi:hypothetical protein